MIGLYKEKKLVERSKQQDDVFSIILDYAHKEEITPEDRKNFLEKLANVEQLCIGGCDFHYQYVTSDFIELVFQLKNLKYLDMSYLRIEGDDIRSIEASELECLLAKHSGLCRLSNNIGVLKKLKYLDLSNTAISTLPYSIGELTNLEVLDLSYTKIRCLPKAFLKLSKLTGLDLGNSELVSLPEDFFVALPELTQLNLNCTRLKELSPLVYKLKRLKRIGFGNASTNVLSVEKLSMMPQLEYLDVSNTGLKKIPENLSDILPKLEGVNFENTRLRNSDIKSVTKLKELKHLNLKNTLVDSIDSSISNLSNLEYLNVSETSIKNVPESIGKLHNLKELYFNKTELEALPDSICQLEHLEVLELEYTKVKWLPSDIGNLTKLKKLRISDTPISALPDSMERLSNLEWLYIEGMTLREIPSFLVEYNLSFQPSYHGYPYDLKGIFIDGLTLTEQPIEIFSQNKELIRAYYREKEKVAVNECKVIFLGDAESGKTYSIKRLLNNGKYLNDFEGESTPGIEITVSPAKIQDKDIVVNYWDFGGQEIQHSMHRVFLTERTVYVVFLNARQDDLMNERARYWLENIKAFAPKSPVLVVINKIDQNGQPRFNEKGIKESYKDQIKNVIRLSAKKDDQESFLDKLQKNINKIIMEVSSVSKRIPKSWKSLMENIRKMEDPYLTTQQFLEKCELYNIKDYEEIHDELVDLFQVIGISFCYYKNRATADYMLLNPRWMLNALYTIITNGKAVARNGVLEQNSLYDLLEKDSIEGITIRRVLPELRYRSSEVNYILGVIRMFGLSYGLKDNAEFFPMLCDGDEKISVSEAVPSDALHFIFRYKYLPTNILHRLIVEMQRDLDYQYVWYTGAVFSNKPQKQKAYIHSVGNDLHIYVYGEEEYYNYNEYLTPIVNIVHDINDSLGLSAMEYLTYTKHGAVAEISLKELKGNIRNGIYEIPESVKLSFKI